MKTLILLLSFLFTTMSFAQFPSYVPANGLVGWWPFNGNANDESGNGNNGTNNGATLTTDRNGNVNSAYSFDGNSGITIPHSTSLNIGSSCTFSFWLKYNNLSNGFNLVFKKGITGGCPDSGYYFAFDGIPGPAHKCFGYGVTGNCSSISDTEYLDNQWHNIIVVYNLQNSQIYFDGVLQDGDANSNLNQTISNTIEPLIIGYYNGPYSGTSWNGLIDDIGIWNRALTPQEITNLYTSTVPPTAAVLSGDATICNGSSTNLNVAVTGGTAPYTVTVTNGTVNYSATGASPVTIPVSPSVTSTYSIVSVTGGGSGTGNTGTATVTVIPNSTNTTPISACDSYTWNGQTYTSSGVYAGTTTNCVTESLNLTITPSSTNTTTITACGSYVWNGTTYTQSGVYTGTTANCVTESLNLTITPSSTNTTTATACDSYLWNETNYTSSGVYIGTTTDCVTQSLNLTITPSSTNTSTASACDSYLWNGTNYSESGVFTGTTTDCVTQSLNLTITPSSTNTTTAAACDSYAWNGQTYTSSGVYAGNTANCVTESLNLIITPSSTNTTTATACNSLTWNGQTYTQSGVYTGTTANCVTQSLNLTINTSTSSSISQTALDSYTWPVNNQTYTTTGAYTAVIPNTSGCDSTITLNLTMSFTGINDLSTSKLSIYPNPTNGDFTITGLELVGTVSSLSLTDMNGKVVKVLDTKATKFSMASIKPGVYFLNIISGNKQEVLKIVKE